MFSFTLTHVAAAASL